VPNAAISAIGDTLRENGLPPPATGGATFLQAKTANEVLKSQERRLKLQKLKGELVDRAHAEALVFRLARETRDAWVNRPRHATSFSTRSTPIRLRPTRKAIRCRWPRRGH
jgi:hypothetical protein